MFTRSSCTAAVVLFVSAGSSSAQPPTAAQREAMKKLDFLVGEWKGEGWLEFVPGQRRTFKGTEVVQSKVDGLLPTIDGLHRGQVGGSGKEVVVHNAFAVVCYDDKAKGYRFQGFTSRGNREDAQPEVADGQLVCRLEIDQFGDVPYTIKRDDKGRWFEIGEVSQNGKERRKFFELTLERVEKK